MARVRGPYSSMKQFLDGHLASVDGRVLKTLQITQPASSDGHVQADVTFIDLHRPLDGALAAGHN
jgi:hypothetical protein